MRYLNPPLNPYIFYGIVFSNDRVVKWFVHVCAISLCTIKLINLYHVYIDFLPKDYSMEKIWVGHYIIFFCGIKYGGSEVNIQFCYKWK